ncbi:MAG: hypothetical protein RI567_11635 [Marinobacter sp.]|nr:hypothetical protein [Marinobacter sp.]
MTTLNSPSSALLLPRLPTKLFLLLVFSAVFFVSLFILPLVLSGDQEAYIKFHALIKNRSFQEAFVIYRQTLGASEPGYFLISWLSGNLGFDRVLFTSLVNGLLALSFAQAALKLRAMQTIVLLIVLTNFYFFALYTELERLKYAFMFAFFSFVNIRNRSAFLVFSALAILSHFQVVLLYIAFSSVFISRSMIRLIFQYRLNVYFVFIVSFLVVLFSIFYEPMAKKVVFYYNGGSFLSIIKAVPFFVLSLVYARNFKKTSMIFLPLLIASFVLGGGRVNILLYFSFLYFALPYRGGANFGFVVTTLYFAIQSARYFPNIFLHGRWYF